MMAKWVDKSGSARRPRLIGSCGKHECALMGTNGSLACMGITQIHLCPGGVREQGYVR